MTARAAATPFATGAPVAPRRALARRFTFRADIGAWPMFQRVLWMAGVGVGLLSLLLQAVSVPVAIAMTALTVSLAALGWLRLGRQRLTTSAAPHTLRWDGAQWWWLPAASQGSSSAPGSPLAVSVTVLLDLEHWMLLRLTPVDAGWRFWRRHFLPISRGNCTGGWPLLRIHLFMARD